MHWGVAKSVRHGTLTPACVGSSPAAPAKYDSLAQLVEHLTFNQGVPGSSPGWITNFFADVAELADALDLGSSAAGRAGSTPVIRTKDYSRNSLRRIPFFFVKPYFVLNRFCCPSVPSYNLQSAH